jgi:Holliday junction resolvase RusA-like endonuclease
MKFVIQGRLAGANDLTHAVHRYVGGKIKREETKRCALAAIAGSVPRFTTPIRLHFKWVEPNKMRDLDNIRYGAKFILDGLQECGKLPDDGWEWVKGMSDEWAVDKTNPRIEITIEEVSNA